MGAVYQQGYARKKVYPKEGLYSITPGDRGGETALGISRVIWPKATIWPLVDAAKSSPDFPKSLLTNDAFWVEVENFYREKFWDRMQLSLVNDQAIADEIMDTGINCGVLGAIQCCQVACNLMNLNQKKWADITPDGKPGPATIAAVNACIADKRMAKALLIALNGEQYMRYRSICFNNPDQEKFFAGWLIGRVGLGENHENS